MKKLLFFTAIAASVLSLALTSCARDADIGEPQTELPSDTLNWTVIPFPLTQQQYSDIKDGKMLHVKFKKNSGSPSFILGILDSYWKTTGEPFYLDEACEKKIAPADGRWDGTYDGKDVFEDADDVDIYYVPTSKLLAVIKEYESNWGDDLEFGFIGNGSYGGCTLLPSPIETLDAPDIPEEDNAVVPFTYTNWKTGESWTYDSVDFTLPIKGKVSVGWDTASLGKDDEDTNVLDINFHGWWDTAVFTPAVRIDWSNKKSLTITLKITDTEPYEDSEGSHTGEAENWDQGELRLVTDDEHKSKVPLSSLTDLPTEYTAITVNFEDLETCYGWDSISETSLPIPNVDLSKITRIEFGGNGAIGHCYIKSIIVE